MALFTVGTMHPRATFFDFNLKYLFLVGLWPNEDWTDQKKWIYMAYKILMFILGFMYIVSTAIGMYMYKEDIIRFLGNVDKTIVAYNYMFKIIMFCVKRKDIQILISKIINSGDTINKEREKLMAFHVVSISGMITSTVTGFQIIAQIKMEMVVDGWMPFNPLKNKYTVFWAGQAIGAMLIFPIIYRGIAIQGIVCSIVMYICDQVEELQKRLTSLTYSVDNDLSVRQEFKEIIMKHIRLMGYSESLKLAFKEYFLMQNLAITAELCLNALMVSFVGIEQKKNLATFLAFLIVALINAYIFCYLGQNLMEQSGGIALAAYESTWTSWPLDMQKDLLIIITVAQKSFKLSAGGIANMCMETFALALYNGYSLFAVLRDVVD